MELISKNTEITEEEQTFLKKNDCLGGVEFLRTILKHPHPQNRAVGDPTTGIVPEGVKDEQVYFWNNGFGTGVISEPQGLLGLSAGNDGTAPPITKKATIDYINVLINKEKTVLEKRNREEQFEITLNILLI
jgi:hypothetical protein